STSTWPPAFSKSARSAEMRSWVRRPCMLPLAPSRVLLRRRVFTSCPGLAIRVACSLKYAYAKRAASRATMPGSNHCARRVVTAVLFVAKRQRDSALQLFAIEPAFVATVLAAHRELAADRGALLVDRAAHAVVVDRHAPAFLVAGHDFQAVFGAGGEVARDAVLGHQHHGQAAADCVTATAR